MNITIIGSGNVATVLGRSFRNAAHVIIEVISRNRSHAAELANELNASAGDDLSNINKQSDMYIIAVNDDAIEEVSSNVFLDEKIVVHTCGSVSMNVLKTTSKNYGVLYPLQSLRKEASYSLVIPFLVNGNNDSIKQSIFHLANSISENVRTANDEERLQYHLSAVVVSNFTNHLFALTKEYCINNKINFSLLLPLIAEVVNRLHFYEPAAMQTGPAIRGDKTTMQKHLAMLEKFPQLKNIYEVMSESIKEF